MSSKIENTFNNDVKGHFMNDFVQTSAFNLFESREVKQHLRSAADSLSPLTYANIIAGAPISLEKKLCLLECLETTVEDKDSHTEIGKYVHRLEQAVDALKTADGSRRILHVSLMYYDDENKCDDCCDGPFPVSTLNKARQAIAVYRIKDDWADDWSDMYWSIELYDLTCKPTYDGFLQPLYEYLATADGEIQFFRMRNADGSRPPLFQDEVRAFGGNSEHLNIPLPFAPGDILRIDNRPFAPGPAYCLIIETGLDCCGVQCMYPCSDGSIGFGALKHGDYFDRCYVFQPSPLYSACRYAGELPDNCKFMEALSKKLYENPELGETLCELWPNLGFSISA